MVLTFLFLRQVSVNHFISLVKVVEGTVCRRVSYKLQELSGLLVNGPWFEVESCFLQMIVVLTTISLSSVFLSFCPSSKGLRKTVDTACGIVPYILKDLSGLLVNSPWLEVVSSC